MKYSHGSRVVFLSVGLCEFLGDSSHCTETPAPLNQRETSFYSIFPAYLNLSLNADVNILTYICLCFASRPHNVFHPEQEPEPRRQGGIIESYWFKLDRAVRAALPVHHLISGHSCTRSIKPHLLPSFSGKVDRF